MSYFTYPSKHSFYMEAGKGHPVIFLHGNSPSFNYLLPLYQEHFHVIGLDFLGNGQSDRVHHFPAELWTSQADQVITLIEYLKLDQASLIGTSDGA